MKTVQSTRWVSRPAPVWKLTAAVGLVLALSGCSLFVMAGKALFGNPKVACEFRLQTGVDLTKGDKTLLVICTTPESVKSEVPSLQLDVVENIHRDLRQHGVRVVDSDKVASWIDESGGFFTDLNELAEEFQPDYIAEVEIERLTFREENSPSMYRGRANGSVYVYEVVGEEGQRRTYQVFVKEFMIEYPRHYPVSAHEMSEKIFQRRFIENLSHYLARIFYDYEPSAAF